MSITTCLEPLLETGVEEFLKRHDLEAEFQKVCELVRDCFPEMRALHIGLLDDPDEDNRRWVVLHVLVPPAHPTDLLQTQRLRYHERLVDQLPLAYHPYFGLVVDFLSE